MTPFIMNECANAQKSEGGENYLRNLLIGAFHVEEE
jgi:hypothetical protein